MSNLLQDMKAIQRRSEIPLFLKKYEINRRICEIGVRYGHHLESLKSARPDLLVGIDHYNVTEDPAQQDTGMPQSKLDEIYRDVVTRFFSIPEIKILRMTSDYAALIFPICSLDYVYVDADHSEKGAYQDIELWYKKVRQGGILAGHDYIDVKSTAGTEFGVITAVQRFLKEKKIDASCFHHTKEGYRTWMIYKTEGE